MVEIFEKSTINASGIFCLDIHFVKYSYWVLFNMNVSETHVRILNSITRNAGVLNNVDAVWILLYSITMARNHDDTIVVPN